MVGHGRWVNTLGVKPVGYFLLLIFSAGIVLTMDRFGDTNLKSQLQGS